MKFQIIQATSQDVSWIAGLEEVTYSRNDAIPEAVLTGWHARNPSGFSVITNAAGGRVGHIDILPLIPGVAGPFLQGEILEREIPASWIVPEGDRTSPRDLYVESIIIKKQPGLASRPALYQVFARFDEIVCRICEPFSVRHIYAIEASAVGKKLMLHSGFERCETKHPRRDGHELFKSSIDSIRSRLAQVLAALG